MRLKFLLSKAVGKISARNTKMEFALLELPNELVAHVIEFVHDSATLRGLACTCARLQQLTEPVLWRELLIRESPKLKGILKAMRTRRERTSALQRLNVPCDSYFQDMRSLAELLEMVQNLRELMIESPSCNAIEFEDLDEWQPMMEQLFSPFQQISGNSDLSPRPLQQLKSLTLHLNGPSSPYWTPDARSLLIFLHPTLSYLKVSCVNFPEDLFNEVNERSVTPLKELILEECNISHEGLHGLLALPKALETLYIGENCHNEQHFVNEVALSYNHLFLRSARSTIDAISQQKHSLRSLVYATAGHFTSNGPFIQRMLRPRQPGVDAGFADFRRLENITCIGSCVGFERAVLSTSSPPNLRTLVYQSDNPITLPHRSSKDRPAEDSYLQSLLPFLRAPSASIPASLEDLHVVYQRNHMQPVYLTSEKREHIRRVSKVLSKAHNINLMITSHTFGSYFPPLLYGEPEPTKRLVYDGSLDRFGRGDGERDNDWLPTRDGDDDDESDS